jgi:hypothetical protein
MCDKFDKKKIYFSNKTMVGISFVCNHNDLLTRNGLTYARFFSKCSFRAHPGTQRHLSLGTRVPTFQGYHCQQSAHGCPEYNEGSIADSVGKYNDIKATKPILVRQISNPINKLLSRRNSAAVILAMMSTLAAYKEAIADVGSGPAIIIDTENPSSIMWNQISYVKKLGKGGYKTVFKVQKLNKNHLETID